VIYGHPFETVNAEAEKAQVEKFFRGNQPGYKPGDSPSPSDFLEQRRVDYLVYGPRERKLGPLPGQLELRQVYAAGVPGADEVVIYQVAGAR
jgi:hypothetical protein